MPPGELLLLGGLLLGLLGHLLLRHLLHGLLSLLFGHHASSYKRSGGCPLVIRAGADERQASRHRNKTTNFSTSCHRRTVRRNKPSFVSILCVESSLDKDLQLHAILIISQIFASTILVEERKKSFVQAHRSPSKARAPHHRARRTIILLPRNCALQRDEFTLLHNKNRRRQMAHERPSMIRSPVGAARVPSARSAIVTRSTRGDASLRRRADRMTGWQRRAACEGRHHAGEERIASSCKAICYEHARQTAASKGARRAARSNRHATAPRERYRPRCPAAPQHAPRATTSDFHQRWIPLHDETFCIRTMPSPRSGAMHSTHR